MMNNVIYLPVHLGYRIGKVFNIEVGLGMEYDMISYNFLNSGGSGYTPLDYSVSQFGVMGEAGCNVQLKKFQISFLYSYRVVSSNDGIGKFSLGCAYAF